MKLGLRWALLLTWCIVVVGCLSSIELAAISRLVLPGSQSSSVSTQIVAKLEGTVLDVLSGRPIAGAEVRLATGRTAFPEDNVPVGFPRPDTFPKPPYSVTTDSSGRFSIQGIRPGDYVVGVSATGYLHYEVGQSSSNLRVGVPINISTETMKPLAVHLTLGATIGGRIMTDERKPLKDVSVYLLWQVQQPADFKGTNRRFTALKTTLSSESGSYEFTAVPEGRYYIFAGRGSSLIPMYRAQPLYGWNFYPGTSDPSRASRIDAVPGANIGGFDLLVKEQQSHRIRGVVIDSRTGKPSEKANVFLHILNPFQGSPGDGGGTLKYDPVNGTFEATGLVDGTYAIGVDLIGPTSAADRAMVLYPRDAWEQLEISGSDRDDIVIQVPRSGYVHGRFVFEGNRSLADMYPGATPIRRVVGNQELIELPGPRVSLQETSSLQPRAFGQNAVNISDGTFEVPNVLSGRYRLQVFNLPAGFYLKSVRKNGSETSNVMLDFRPEEKTQLDIIIAPGAGEVQGAIVNDVREPLSGSGGLLFPDPLPDEIGSYSSFITDKDGKFVLSNVPPGRYRIYVFNGPSLADIMPETEMYRRSAALATPVIVTEGSKLSITARAINSK